MSLNESLMSDNKSNIGLPIQTIILGFTFFISSSRDGSAQLTISLGTLFFSF